MFHRQLMKDRDVSEFVADLGKGVIQPGISTIDV